MGSERGLWEKRVNRRRRQIGTVLVLAAMALPGCKDRDSAIKTIKIGTVLPESHPTAASLKHFQQRIEELSDGRFKADIFYNSQLGSADEVLELCRMGDVEMAQVSAAILGVYVRSSHALAMPFIRAMTVKPWLTAWSTTRSAWLQS